MRNITDCLGPISWRPQRKAGVGCARIADFWLLSSSVLVSAQQLLARLLPMWTEARLKALAELLGKQMPVLAAQLLGVLFHTWIPGRKTTRVANPTPPQAIPTVEHPVDHD